MIQIFDNNLTPAPGAVHTLPKQSFIQRGLFTVNERKFERPDTGEPIVTFTTYATQKGIAWIIGQFSPSEKPIA